MSADGTRLYHPMRGRHPDTPHRASTPLELLFDLCFVVAVAQASTHLHHSLADDRLGHAAYGYLTVFFAIWWAWVNFSWFASAYDTDDLPYRLTTFVQIAGALVLAAGIPRAFDRADFTVVTFGYVVMRLALVGQWLRAAHGDPDHRVTALRFAIGVTLVQAGWVGRLALPGDWLVPTFFVLMVAELAVPVVAERARTTGWHAGHIAERYGLFTLIVLGEAVQSAAFAIQAALDAGGGLGLLELVGSGLVIIFAMWWLYFAQPGSAVLRSGAIAFLWGYCHYFVFSSAAALGAGLALAADRHGGGTVASGLVAGYAVALPAAVYVLSVWLLQVVPRHEGLWVSSYPVAAGLLLLTPFTPAAIPLTAVILAGLVALVVTRRRLRVG